MLLVYLGAAFLIRFFRDDGRIYGRHERRAKGWIVHVFEGAAMAASLTVLWGVVDPAILEMLGETTPYLMIAGVGGVYYSVAALFD